MTNREWTIKRSDPFGPVAGLVHGLADGSLQYIWKEWTENRVHLGKIRNLVEIRFSAQANPGTAGKVAGRMNTALRPLFVHADSRRDPYEKDSRRVQVYFIAYYDWNSCRSQVTTARRT